MTLYIIKALLTSGPETDGEYVRKGPKKAGKTCIYTHTHTLFLAHVLKSLTIVYSTGDCKLVRFKQVLNE